MEMYNDHALRNSQPFNSHTKQINPAWENIQNNQASVGGGSGIYSGFGQLQITT